MKTALGSALILICSFALGKQGVNRQKSRMNDTKLVLDLLVFIKDGITVFLTPLPDIYQRFNCGEPFKTLLCRQGILTACQALCLSPSALNAVKELNVTLGAVDSQTQREKLDLCIRQIADEAQNAREDYQKHSKSVLALYVLAGMLTVLLLL